MSSFTKKGTRDRAKNVLEKYPDMDLDDANEIAINMMNIQRKVPGISAKNAMMIAKNTANTQMEVNNNNSNSSIHFSNYNFSNNNSNNSNDRNFRKINFTTTRKAPRRALFSDPDDYKTDTLDRICSEIREYYAGKFIDEDDATKPVSSRQTLLQVMRKEDSDQHENKKLLKKMVRMQSSGSSNDCLIHSFLTALCGPFRRLKLEDKKEVASTLRRKVLPVLIPSREKSLKGRSFLEEGDISPIKDLFKVNVLMLQSEREDEDMGIRELPRSAFFTRSGKDPVIVLFNNDNIHFESVKIGDFYRIPYKAAERISAECIFNKGDEVLHGNAYEETKKGVVRSAHHSESGVCEAYTLKFEDGKTRKVKADDVILLQGGGGRRKTRRRRRGSCL